MKKLSALQKIIFGTFLLVFHMSALFAQDIGVHGIITPSATGTLNSNVSQPVTVMIYNYSAATVNSFPVNYAIDGASVGAVVFNITLIGFDSIQVSLNPATFINGSHQFCVFTELAGDADMTNDSNCINVNVLSYTALPFQTDFEGAPPVGWIYGIPQSGPPQWEWGTPAFGVTTGAHSGVSAFDVDLDSGYAAGTDILQTEAFDFSQSTHPRISFWQNRDIKPGNDGLKFEITLDNGISWNAVGDYGTPDGHNWYNDSLASTGQPDWDGNSGGWEYSYINMPILSGYNGQVSFRFVFEGTSGGGFAGVSIDDFKIEPDAFQATQVINNIFCNGDSTNIGVIASGGTPPYNYQWSNGVTTAVNSGILAGTYIAFIVDATNDTIVSVFNITEPPQIIVTTTTTPATCTQSNGTATLHVTGGYPGIYTYSWVGFPGVIDSVNTGLATGSYVYNVTDSFGCTIAGSVVVPNSSPMIVQQTTVQNPTTCAACDGFVSLNVNGGTAPYTFQWNGSPGTQAISNLCTGVYSCLVSDAAGCTFFLTDYLQTTSFSAMATATAAGCGQPDGTASVNAIGGAAPYVYHWSQGSTLQSIANLNAGVYSVYINDSFNCYAQATVVIDDSCHGVWPGDANYDLTVDNNDLISLGLAYGSTGPVRPGATLNWIAQPASAWSQNFTSGANYKNADCNGDGIIDANDTTAILQNYGLAHAFKLTPIPQTLPGQPDLYLVVTSDTTGLSDTVTIDAFLGNSSVPVDSIFGLAFTIYTDPSLVDSSMGAVDFSNCWIGTPGINLLTLSKNRLAQGAIDIALVRTDHTNVSGNGAIARAIVVTTDNIAGKGFTPSTALLNFSISNLTAITVNELELLFNLAGDSLVIDSAFTSGIQSFNLDKQISVNPNPSNGIFVIQNKSDKNNLELNVSDVLGNIIYSGKMNDHLNVLDLRKNNSGIYFLSIRSEKMLLNKKLIIVH